MIGAVLLICSASIHSFSQSAYLPASVRSVSQFTKVAASATNFAIPITGKILNEKGEPLAGATIMIKGSTVTTTTDTQGAFTINAPDANATLVITYTGYQTQELALNNRTTLSVTLLANNDLESVVVVGYGTRRRTDVTGAIASINSEKIRSVPTTNLSQALQGRVAGVEVMASSFRPGSGSRVLCAKL